MTILTVGTDKGFATLAGAIAASSAGDTIQVDAGTYTDDFATITHDLTIQGIGGMAKLLAVAAPPNGKAILTINANVTLDHLEFAGAVVPDGNGAGIRYEGGNLVITNSWFHDNQDGLLAASSVNGTITIDHSEFNNNGTGTGQTHNLYVNDIAKLTITNSYFHDVATGHEIKSRARETVITGNRIIDGSALGASYSIDLPDGGASTITGNTIEKGPLAPNRTFIHLGGERFPSYANTSLLVSGNIFVSHTAGPPTVLRNDSSVGGLNAPATMSGNSFWGITESQLAIGSATMAGNFFPGGAAPLPDLSHPFAEPPACFCTGTRLATAAGPVAVENLLPGDEVITAFGPARVVRWVGTRSLDCRRHPRPWDVLPVCVAAGAFSSGVPSRDLFLTPDHALFVDGVLIPVRYLLNGATIRQEEAGEVAYYHVEVQDARGDAAHSVLLAEGLPAESYLDTGNRNAFANGGGAALLHPDFARPDFARPDFAHTVWQNSAVAPLVLSGPVLRAVRRRLALRATAIGHALTSDTGLSLEVDGKQLPRLAGTGPATFLLPYGAQTARLHSRSFVPAHVIADSTDHRRLGVGVTRLRLDDRTVDLGTLGEGWHAPEVGHRWTDGAGRIVLDGARRVQIEIGLDGLYWQHPVTAVKERHAIAA